MTSEGRGSGKSHGTRRNLGQTWKEQEALRPRRWGKGGCPRRREQHKAKIPYSFLIATVTNHHKFRW